MNDRMLRRVIEERFNIEEIMAVVSDVYGRIIVEDIPLLATKSYIIMYILGLCARRGNCESLALQFAKANKAAAPELLAASTAIPDTYTEPTASEDTIVRLTFDHKFADGTSESNIETARNVLAAALRIDPKYISIERLGMNDGGVDMRVRMTDESQIARAISSPAVVQELAKFGCKAEIAPANSVSDNKNSAPLVLSVLLAIAAVLLFAIAVLAIQVSLEGAPQPSLPATEFVPDVFLITPEPQETAVSEETSEDSPSETAVSEEIPPENTPETAVETLDPQETAVSEETSEDSPSETAVSENPTTAATVTANPTQPPPPSPTPPPTGVPTATQAPLPTAVPAATPTPRPTLPPTYTPLPTPTKVDVPHYTPTPTNTPTPTDTPLPTPTFTAVPTATSTPLPTPTSTPTTDPYPAPPTATPGSYPGPTNTPVFVPSPTPRPTATPRPPTPTKTPLPSPVGETATVVVIPPTATYTAVPTSTPLPTATYTAVPTSTPLPTATSTAVPSPTLVPTATSTAVVAATATRCPPPCPPPDPTRLPPGNGDSAPNEQAADGLFGVELIAVLFFAAIKSIRHIWASLG